MERNPQITFVKGTASFKDSYTVNVTEISGGQKSIKADYFLIATGSSPFIPPVPGLKDFPYWTSNEALSAEKVPSHLVVIGGSLIALELGQAFSRLGSKVTIVARSTLFSRKDPVIGKSLKAILEDEGIRILTHASATKVSYDGQQFSIDLDTEKLVSEKLLVAAGRKPNTERINLETAGVETNDKESVIIDEFMKTSVSHIYAAGDCATLPQFVYVAAAAGTRAVSNMMGGKSALDLRTMPEIVFTDPQVATVGLTENHAIQQGIKTESRTLPLDQVARALVNSETSGFIKLVAEAQSGRLLGAQILTSEASEIIQVAALAIRNNMTVKDLGEELFPYLTMAEGIKLCALMFYKDIKQLSCCAG